MFKEPEVRIIQIISEASPDEAFKKPKFKRYFDLYKARGLTADRAEVMTPKRAETYRRIINNKNKRFAKNNPHLFDTKMGGK